MWIQFGQQAGLTLIGFFTGVAISRTHCELRHPMIGSTGWPINDVGGWRHTDGMSMTSAKEAIGP